MDRFPRCGAMSPPHLHHGFCCCCCLVSQLRPLFCGPRTVAPQPPGSVGFSRQECWRGCRFLLQGIFLTQGQNPPLQWQADSSPPSHQEGRFPKRPRGRCRDINVSGAHTCVRPGFPGPASPGLLLPETIPPAASRRPAPALARRRNSRGSGERVVRTEGGFPRVETGLLHENSFFMVCWS